MFFKFYPRTGWPSSFGIFFAARQKQIICAVAVTAQEIGYDRYRIASDRCAANMVKIQITRSPQAPVRETSVGRIEYPSPRMLPTIVSITPHRKYVVQMIDIRSSP